MDEGYLPTQRGFDRMLGFLGGGEDHYTQRVGAGVDLWEDDGPAYGLNGTAYSCDLYSRKAVSYIEEHARDHADAGMFLYLPFHCTHEPYEAESRFLDPLTADHGRQTMAAMVSCVSEGTGNVSRALKAAGMWEDSLFVWAADNGGPQYWLGNNYPFRGGKGTDFEGGVRVAAFVTGGALPSALRGSASWSPLHVSDLHVTICRLAGLTDAQCRDDDTAGVPPVDGVHFPAAFAELNATRPVAAGRGPSAGTQELLLSSNAFIDFGPADGPWKYVANTTTVIKNQASPLGSGYWTGPVWPLDGNNHSFLEPDTGCPTGGCLFNLRLDATEHLEFSAAQPARKAAMKARMAQLKAGRWQSGNYTAGYDNCTAEATAVALRHGFVGPVCTKGPPPPPSPRPPPPPTPPSPLPTPAPAPTPTCSFSDAVNWMGQWFHSASVHAPSAEACCALCKQEAACVGPAVFTDAQLCSGGTCINGTQRCFLNAKAGTGRHYDNVVACSPAR